jgi:chemotaxis protein MotB
MVQWGGARARQTEVSGVVVPPPAVIEQPPLSSHSERSWARGSGDARAIRQPATRRGQLSRAWAVLVVVVGVAVVAGLFFYQRLRAVDRELAAHRAWLAEARKQAAISGQDLMEARANQARAADENARLRRELQGAAARAEKADELAEKLQRVVGEQGTVTQQSDRLTLEMVDKVLFRSAEAVLTPRGERVLSGLGEALKKFPEKQIWVQGHTDDVPIGRAEFSSNWELSVARALTVVHYLEDVAAVDPRRLAVVGFGEHRPVSRRVRSRNRRIEIVLFPREVTLSGD